MRKKISMVLIVLIILASVRTNCYAAEDDILELQRLISTGEAITDSSSAEAFVWINNVLKYIEKHKDSFVYEDIKSEATSAKNYTSISTLNKQNIIIGYLEFLEDELNNVETKDVPQLISEAKTIRNYNSPQAYKWLVEVIQSMEQYSSYQITQDILDEVKSAKGYSNTSTLNKFNKALGYLELLDDELNNVEIKDVSQLISEAETIRNYDSPQAYKWLVEVIQSMEQYSSYQITQDILDEVKSAKGYSSTSTLNKNNIALGYMMYLEEKVKSSNATMTSNKIYTLISEGNNISDWGSCKAYKWLMDVSEYNNEFSDTSVYESLEEHCKKAMGYSSISTLNYNNLILSDLMLMEQEIPKTVVLTKIEIINPPNKTIYTEGDLFNPNGMSIDAVYTYVYSDNSSLEKKKTITNYVVDTSTALSCDDEVWTIYYTEGEVTQTAEQQITVNPILVSETLKSIEIAKAPNKTVYKEGECFSKYGMRIDALYDQYWSNGTYSTTKKTNVAYSVDTVTKLKASDTSVTISVIDGDINLSLEQGITVETHICSEVLDSIKIIKNPDKLSYKSGEKFDKTGMIVDAKYKCVWSNGYTEYIIKENIDYYTVNTSSPLIAGTTKITVSVIDKGIKKTADIPISVVSQYKNEWVDKRWYDDSGNQTYNGILSWKSNSIGWWVEDNAGWYPQDSWQKIDGIWYYFKPDGYMASSEYYGGYWFNGDGSWDDQYYLTWKSNSTGWWVEDKSGWWPSNKWLKINGSWYYFDSSGYMVTSQYIDGYWIGADGVCQ